MSKSLSKKEKRRIWNKLKEVALEDGNFTTEEQELMATVIIDLEQYSKMINQVMEDGKIDANEKRELFEGRMKIMEKAYETARKDRIISEDEQAILKEICKVIRNLYND